MRCGLHKQGWKQGTAGSNASNQAFVPLTFAPGEAYQFDWAGEDWIVLDGVTTKVQVAHIRLCQGGPMWFVQVYPRQTQEMVFAAHERACASSAGSAGVGSMKHEDGGRGVFVGRERGFNRRFARMCSHYLVEPVACSPGAGWEKGQVENQVGNVRETCSRRGCALPATTSSTRGWREVVAWGAQGALHPGAPGSHGVGGVPGRAVGADSAITEPFDGFQETGTVSASKTCLIALRSQPLQRGGGRGRQAGAGARLCRPDRRVVQRAEGWRAAPGGSSGVTPRSTIRWHYLPILARKPGALRNGAPFREWELPPGPGPGENNRLGRSHDADRQFVAILGAILTDGLDAVEAACHRGAEGRGGPAAAT